MKYKVYVSVLALALIYGCNNGERRVYYDTGELRTICETNKGVTNGKCTYYYKDGKMKGKSYFVDGLQEGKTVNFDNLGNKIGEYMFARGKANGSFVEYFSDGQIKATGFYKDGELDSLGYEYYSNGDLNRVYYYSDDTLSYFKDYDKNGTMVDCLLPLKVSSNMRNDSLLISVELMYSLHKNDITLGVIFAHLSGDNIPIDTIDFVGVHDMLLNEYPVKNSNIIRSDNEITGVAFEIENSTDLIKGHYYFRHSLGK